MAAEDAGLEPVANTTPPESVDSVTNALTQIIQSSQAKSAQLLENKAKAEAEYKTLELQIVTVEGQTLIQIGPDDAPEYQKYLAPAAAVDFVLMRAFALTQGVVLSVSDAWRSGDVQRQRYQANPQNAAKPGTSKHEKGLAIDIDVGAGGQKYVVPKGSAAYQFLETYGPQFGFFVLKDEAGIVVEAWHYNHPSEVPVGSVAGLAISVKTPSGEAVPSLNVASSGKSGFAADFVLSHVNASQAAPLSIRQYNALRFGAAVSRQALAESIKREGTTLANVLNAQGLFKAYAGLDLYNPYTGKWSDGGLV